MYARCPAEHNLLFPRLASARHRAKGGRRVSISTTASVTELSADVLSSVTDALAGSPLKLAGTFAISFATFRTILYFRLEYILASHLSRNVPPKSRVVAYGIGTGKTVNYYPPTTVGIYGVDPKADSGLLLQVGGSAGQTVSAQKSDFDARLALEAGSMDAVVTVRGIGKSDKITDCLREAARVLKPGGRLIFFEEGDGGSRFYDALKANPLYTDAQKDDKWGRYFLAPNTIGVAIRATAAVPEVSAGGAGGGGKNFKRTPKEAPRAKSGFGSAGKSAAGGAEMRET